jgi:hypothetical protein
VPAWFTVPDWNGSLTDVTCGARRNSGPVLAGDPGAIEMLRSRTEVSDVVDRLIKLIADVEPGVGGSIKADMVMAGIAGGMTARARGIDDDLLRRHLIEASRRTLGLRAPRCLR